MSPRLVILGSLGGGDYEVTYPIRNSMYNTEEGYRLACERFYPAIDAADVVLVYGEPGEHTSRDIEYAESKGKTVIPLNRVSVLEAEKGAVSGSLVERFQFILSQEFEEPPLNFLKAAERLVGAVPWGTEREILLRENTALQNSLSEAENQMKKMKSVVSDLYWRTDHLTVKSIEEERLKKRPRKRWIKMLESIAGEHYSLCLEFEKAISLQSGALRGGEATEK